VPPMDRRGLVLVDPACEDAGDFARLGQGLVAAHRKWASGMFLGWYPIKERAAPDALARRLRNSGIPKILRAELSVAARREPSRLVACGLIMINPPWTLADELAILLPELAVALSRKGGGAHRLDWLAGER
jgi:23S rRNA (adenine2030-N6)-methyltransferase